MDVLLADIGATNSRFGMLGSDGRPQHVLAFPDQRVADLEGAIAHYMDTTGARPSAALLAVAGPIESDAITLTNRNWRFRLSDIASRFKLSPVRAINDFEAVAWSLPRLSSNDLHPIGQTGAEKLGAKLVLGPGTGLGVGALVPVADGWRVIASEAGHVSFGPSDEAEECVFARLRAEHGFVSAETILSGPGLERLHRALHGGGAQAADVIASCGARGEAPACATLKLFVRLLGRFAGDMALAFKASGGVYIAGGVAQRIAGLLDDAAFRRAFEAHPPYAHLLESFPTSLVTLPEPGLLGCATAAEQLIGSAPQHLEARRLA